jgi:GTPase SAR1 family protein
MPRLEESLARFFGRVEILARGAEEERRLAEEALLRGRALDARDHARELLARVPGSPLGLALWADAAEDAWLDHEVVTALIELVKQVPWGADVWLRLGRAGQRVNWPGAREALERAAAARDQRESARLALLDLCDLDLQAGDPGRALRWLDRIPTLLVGPDREVALRRAECALAFGDLEAAALAMETLGEEWSGTDSGARGTGGADGSPKTSAVDGRVALARARLAFALGKDATDAALRAFILDTPGASELLAAIVAACRDVIVVGRIRRVVAAAGVLDEPQWAAAFAFAEGRRDDARQALARGLGAGDPSAAAALLRLATETRDLDALQALAARDVSLLSPDQRILRDAAALAAEGRDAEALGKLDQVGGDAAAWASEIRAEIVARWLPGETVAAWELILAELRRTARTLDRIDLLGAIEALAVERERPLRVAVVGEFNAGKSTFLNALLGVDVAPTGVLPTTATLHWVAWAPDPFARVVVRGSPDRVVPHAELKPTLKALDEASAKVERVFIYAPIERLKRVEILDTPGFNAPDPDHIAAARQAFDEAHVAIWLLDATGPMKETERRVLAEVRDLGVPVQILANKADRLQAADRERMLEHVRDSLAGAGITSLTPPIAFSARLSLRGRLGDEAALAASGWAEVEALLSERIVDTSSALREGALRRRALRIAVEQAELAGARAAEDRSAARAALEQSEALRAAAARLSRERAALAPTIDHALETARGVLAADLRPLAELPEDRRRGDPGLRAYVLERVVARLTEPVALEIGRAVSVTPPSRAIAAVRAVIMGAVAASESPADLVQRPLERVLWAAIDAFAGALLAEAAQARPPAASAAIEQRALAMRSALQGMAELSRAPGTPEPQV